MREKNLINHIGKQAALLSAIEIGLGSILHSFRLPFSGHTLSLNQGFLMSRATLARRNDKGARFIPVHMGNIAALLKSLSPAGKKLTPMLAISTQGFLYSIGVIVFGINTAGILVGMLLLSLWAFLQPILLYYLLYGKTIIHIADYFYDKLAKVFPLTPEVLVAILATVVTAKVLLGQIIGVLAIRLPGHLVNDQYEYLVEKAKSAPRFQNLVQENSDKPSSSHKLSFIQNAKLALLDLMNPLFILSLFITAFFFLFTKTNATPLIWILMRPIAIGYLLFLLVRIFPVEQLFANNKSRFSHSLQIAMRHLREL